MIKKTYLMNEDQRLFITKQFKNYLNLISVRPIINKIENLSKISYTLGVIIYWNQRYLNS